MNAYEKAQSLGLTGSDADIVTELQHVTEVDIDSKAAAEWLEYHEIWEERPGGMEGPLADAYALSEGFARKRLSAIWRWIYKDGGVIKSSGAKGNPNGATAPAKYLAYALTQGGVSSSDKAEFYKLGSAGGDVDGRIYKSLTEAEYDAQRTASLQAAADERTQNALRAYLTAKRSVIDERLENGQYGSEADLIADVQAVYVTGGD